MLRTLQSRFALSHLLPVLLVIPLIGLAALYLVETRYFLDRLASELVVQGSLIAELIQGDAQLWNDPQAAAQLVARLQPNLQARLMLLDRSGHLLSSSLVSDESRVGQVITSPVVADARNGAPAWQSIYSTGLHEQIVDVALPAFNRQAQVIGIVRLSHRMSEARAELSTLRWVLVAPFLVGIVVAIGLALFLANSLAQPLLRLRYAMAHWNIQQPPEPITEHGPEQIRALIAQFNLMASQLHELEGGRRRLLASIIHELGRPIGAIKLAAQYLVEYYTDDPATTKEMIVDIDEQTDHLQTMLDDLVLLANSSESQFGLDIQQVDVAPILKTQVDLLALKVAAKKIALVCQIVPNLPRAAVDPTRFAQIISNLLDNAGKYTPAEGRVTLTASVADVVAEATAKAVHRQMLAIEISDTGPGIPPAEQEKIFQFFYRSSNSSADVQQGMGIGLALARQLAEAQGGQLIVRSRPGNGATFVLYAPLA
ncbi:MAG: sensor histidine kinase [Caldilineaceae bacterium]|nr:sensor histidine kinase [Caldilineaceae bacterium]